MVSTSHKGLLLGNKSQSTCNQKLIISYEKRGLGCSQEDFITGEGEKIRDTKERWQINVNRIFSVVTILNHWSLSLWLWKYQ